MSWKLADYEECKGEYRLTYEVMPGFWGRLFGRKPRIREFEGGGTVWRELPSYSRCDVFTESFLCDAYTRIVSPFSQKS